MIPSGSPIQLEQRRQQAVLLFEQGFTPVDIARRLGVERRSVRRWKAAFLKQGPAGIKAKPASGRPSHLDTKKKNRLERILMRGAIHAGYPTDLWTCSRVAEVIRQIFEVAYHVRYLPRLLRSMGWTPQKPERRARERDEKAILHWIKVDWPHIKKKPDA